MLAGLEEDERIWPSSPLPHLEDASPAEIRMAQFDAEQQTDYVSANELLLRLSPSQWALEWIRWIVFLQGASSNGGVVHGWAFGA